MVRAVKWSSDPDSGGIILSEQQYTYDAHNRRIRILTDADGAGPGSPEVTNIVYDGDNAWVDFNVAGEAVARYLFGNRIDQVLAQHRPGEGTSWYLASMLHTVRDIVNSQAQVQNHIDYATFGQPILQTNAAFANRYMFTAREYAPQLAMYYYRARFYDATIGCLASSDPIGFESNDTNLFRFVLGNPQTYADPTGTGPVLEAAIIDTMKYLALSYLSYLSTDIIVKFRCGSEYQAKAAAKTLHGALAAGSAKAFETTIVTQAVKHAGLKVTFGLTLTSKVAGGMAGGPLAFAGFLLLSLIVPCSWLGYDESQS